MARIKEGGYDIFLVLEATIGVSKLGEHTTDKTSLVRAEFVLAGAKKELELV